jgi:hypothetical protein
VEAKSVRGDRPSDSQSADSRREWSAPKLTVAEVASQTESVFANPGDGGGGHKS